VDRARKEGALGEGALGDRAQDVGAQDVGGLGPAGMETEPGIWGRPSTDGSQGTGVVGSSDGSWGSEVGSFGLDVQASVRFSVWVSFCEIYNDNIHDLLEQVPSGHHKRTVLRLSQDVKGNSFIKDLRWLQVSSSDEAYRVMKIERKNQSFSSTRLNHQSSRSHSIFYIRILRVEDIGVPRVLGISELSLCDLAGSERCSRTLNTGDWLKEAGNINSSLLTLGKCINTIMPTSKPQDPSEQPNPEVQDPSELPAPGPVGAADLRAPRLVGAADDPCSLGPVGGRPTPDPRAPAPATPAPSPSRPAPAPRPGGLQLPIPPSRSTPEPPCWAPL